VAVSYKQLNLELTKVACFMALTWFDEWRSMVKDF